MWRSLHARLALLELVVCGSLRRRRGQDEAWRELAALPWTRTSTRRDELVLSESHRLEVTALLDRTWPGWGSVWADMQALGFEPTPKGWARLEDHERAARVGPLPERVNRKTAAALVAPHSKATLTEGRLAALGPVETMRDGLVRLRPPTGLLARNARGEVDLRRVAEVLGEVALAERAFDALVFEGEIRAALLVENLGAFVDVPQPEGWLIAHVAGWDTATVRHMLSRLIDVPVVHFGDIDPAGVRIFRHLRSMRSDLRWFVPDFSAELVETHGLELAWPDDLDVADCPLVVRECARRGVWLEQEAIAVDPRMMAALMASGAIAWR